MCGNEVLVENVLHVASIEKRVGNAIDVRVHLCILDGFGHILDANDLTSLFCHKIGNRASARVEVIHQFVARQLGKVARHLIQLVCLFGVRLIERLGSHLEAQVFHLFVDVVLALHHVNLLVAKRIVSLMIINIKE